MKYFLVKSRLINLTRLVYAETKYHAISLIRHEFSDHNFNDFIITLL